MLALSPFRASDAPRRLPISLQDRRPKRPPRRPQEGGPESQEDSRDRQQAPKKPKRSPRRGPKQAPRGSPEASRETSTGIQDVSDPQPRHGGGLARRPLDPPPPVACHRGARRARCPNGFGSFYMFPIWSRPNPSATRNKYIPSVLPLEMAPRWHPRRPRWPPIRLILPQESPRWAQVVSKTAQDGPKTAQDGPKIAQNGPRSSQRASKSSKRLPRQPPGRPEEAKSLVLLRSLKDFDVRSFSACRRPKKAQEGPNMAPRGLQDGPMMALKRSLEGSKTVQDCLQDG